MNGRRFAMVGTKRLVGGLMFLMFGIAFVAVISLVVLGLWNYAVPAIFGLPRIGYWQAAALLVLSKILFGRFGGPGRRRRFVTGWSDLTPEERERFRKAMGDRCPHENA
jgi:hypothetical protein